MASIYGRLKRVLTLFIATGAGVGYIPGAPGTYGSMLGVAIFMFLPSRESPAAFIAALFAVFVAGMAVCGAAEVMLGEEDSPRIVVDEVAGQMFALTALVSGPMVTDAELPYMVAAAFVLFRTLDILKPWPIRQFENIEGGAGVMLDDAVAGAIALVVLLVGRMLI